MTVDRSTGAAGAVVPVVAVVVVSRDTVVGDVVTRSVVSPLSPTTANVRPPTNATRTATVNRTQRVLIDDSFVVARPACDAAPARGRGEQPYTAAAARSDDERLVDERRPMVRTIDTVRRWGVAVEPATTIRDTAQLMEQAGVGAVAVVDGEALVGIVTDRDLVRRALAREYPGDARIDSVMSSPVVTIDADADLHEAYAVFRTHAVRRLAVTNDGRFVGTVTIDDLLIDLAADLSDLARPVTAEVLFAHRDSEAPAVTS
jgi:CBS domain-containing protein